LSQCASQLYHQLKQRIMSAMIVIAIIVLGVSLYDYFDSKDWQQITCVDRINVVFEERNKKYGAYSIRRDYNDLVLFIVLGLVGLVAIATIVNTGMSMTTTELALPVVELDTTLMTLEAPPMDHIETIPTPYKIVGGGGSGTPDNSKYDPTPNDMLQDPGIMPSVTPFKPGKGNKNNGKNPNEEASTTVKSPFSGTGGSGGGDKGGKGKGFGNDTGPSEGPGFGPGKGTKVRKWTSEPSVSSIKSDENCSVYLRIKFDEDGNVVGTPVYDRGKSSTNNTVIINEVIRLVKLQAKIEKDPGSPVIEKTRGFDLLAN